MIVVQYFIILYDWFVEKREQLTSRLKTWNLLIRQSYVARKTLSGEKYNFIPQAILSEITSKESYLEPFSRIPVQEEWIRNRVHHLGICSKVTFSKQALLQMCVKVTSSAKTSTSTWKTIVQHLKFRICPRLLRIFLE